ncbi:MAG: TIGR01777 family protein, partial [Chloroflexales bacterium]|nr:TIGR01777 family protein [Chloroflexales bacterium]
TGLIGRSLCQRLLERGYELTVFSRDSRAARKRVPGTQQYVDWSPAESGPWASALDGAYAVINLAGAPVFGRRWSEAYKREIRDSRVIGTRGLVRAALSATNGPQVFVAGSAVGYYGFRDDTPLDESAAPGNDFLARVCVDWEGEARPAEAAGMRTVLLRTGIVLSLEEGALPQMLLPFKLRGGGPILPGTQWLPWVHLADQVGLIMLALEDERIGGPLNASAPEPLRNRDFAALLGKHYGTPSWLPVPGFSLRVLLGEVADMISEGQRVIPRKALDNGYQFRFPTAEAALRDLFKKP